MAKQRTLLKVENENKAIEGGTSSSTAQEPHGLGSVYLAFLWLRSGWQEQPGCFCRWGYAEQQV
jgi:hypothetical protein